MGNLSTPKSVQKLQTALHAKAKAEAGYRFYALYDKISRDDILAHAYAQCRSNKGAPGIGRMGRQLLSTASSANYGGLVDMRKSHRRMKLSKGTEFPH